MSFLPPPSRFVALACFTLLIGMSSGCRGDFNTTGALDEDDELRIEPFIWEARNTGLTDQRVDALMFAPNGTLFAGTGSGVYRSANAGTSWERTLAPGRAMLALAIDPKNTIYARSNLGVFRSDDNGTRWAETELIRNDIAALLMTPTGVLWAGTTSGEVFRSDAGGQSWKRTSNGLPQVPVRAMARDQQGTLYVALNGEGLYRSTNEGVSWQPTGLNTGFVNALVSDGTDLFAATTFRTVLHSSDGGSTWTPVGPNGLTLPTVHALARGPNGHLFAGTDGDGLYRSTDGGQRWVALNDTTLDAVVLTLALDADGFLYAGGAERGTFRSREPLGR